MLADGTPYLLTTKFDLFMREITEKAVLLYIRDFKFLSPYLTVVGLQEVEESRLTDKKGAL